MDIEQNMNLFQELLCCGNSIYTWCYDADGTLLYSNCPSESLFGAAFSLLGCRERALQIGKSGGQPQAVGTSFGLIWGVDFLRRENALHRMYVFGPVFSYNVSLQDIENGFRHYTSQEISLAWKHQLLGAYNRIPVVQSTLFTRYLLMLHYCITGEKLDASDTIIQQSFTDAAPAVTKRDRHRVWQAECALLDMVRTGDLNYKDALNTSLLISAGVPVLGSDPLRQAKTSVIVFISIVCRAAIEGGLSPDAAYSLGDSYIQSAENARTYDEINAIPLLMYDDFIHRVHRVRQSPRYSAPITQCRDYIEMHLEEKIRARDLADLVGYTEYYLTHKFKEETGVSVSDYVKNAKIRRAKILLRSTELSIQELSDYLCFSSRNYFSRVFSEIVGCTPMEYREKDAAPFTADSPR